MESPPLRSPQHTLLACPRSNSPAPHPPPLPTRSGTICLDILKDKWTAAYSVSTVLISLQSLLGEPNNDSPLNPQVIPRESSSSARATH